MGGTQTRDGFRRVGPGPSATDLHTGLYWHSSNYVRKSTSVAKRKWKDVLVQSCLWRVSSVFRQIIAVEHLILKNCSPPPYPCESYVVHLVPQQSCSKMCLLKRV